MQKETSTGEFRKRLYFFTLKLIELIDTLPKDNVTLNISDELFRSGTAVIGNYIKGMAAESRKDERTFILNAVKSANEAKLWLALVRDSNRAKTQKVKWFLDELDEISTLLTESLDK